MRKKIVLLALIAGMVILTTLSFLIAKEIEKNKQQKKRTVKFVNQEKPSNVFKNKQLKKINQNTNVSQEQKDNKCEPIINKNTNKNTNINVKDKYKGELTKEADGWKKYRNEYWGVEFRFRDKKDEMKVAEWSVGVIVADSKSENPYIYIDFYKNDFKLNQKQYNTLKEYLEAGEWDVYQESAELISIKEVVNNNGLRFIEIIAKVSGGRQIKGYYKNKKYYIEYDKKQRDKNIIKIHYADFNMPKDIIDTFKFID